MLIDELTKEQLSKLEDILVFICSIDKSILISCLKKKKEKKEKKEQQNDDDHLSYLQNELKILTEKLYTVDSDQLDALTSQMKSLRIKIDKLKSEKKGQSSDCITRSKVTLRPYQVNAIKFINDPKQKSLLVVHGTGTGKTLTALAASQCYLDQYPNNKVVVVSPASITHNFEKEMEKYGGKLSKNYSFYSFDKFRAMNKDGDYDCKNTMLVVDEVHNTRNQTAAYDAVYNCAKESHKLLLLSATPFVNRLADLKPIIYMLYRDDGILLQKDISIPQKFSNAESYHKALRNIFLVLNGKVTYLNDKKSEDFPQAREHKIEIPMTHDYFRRYKKALEEDKDFGDSPEKFYHGYRRAVNKVGASNYVNEKLNSVLDLIKKGNQTLVFTNWLEAGVEVLERTFRDNDISYLEITGSVPSNSRMDIVKKFNEGEVQVLIITMAGSEGLDLKGVRNIIILDPVWNPATYEQIIGRGIRYKSHTHLPKNERFVDIYMLILESLSHEVPSGDEILYKFIEEKKGTLADVIEILKEASIY